MFALIRLLCRWHLVQRNAQMLLRQNCRLSDEAEFSNAFFQNVLRNRTARLLCEKIVICCADHCIIVLLIDNDGILIEIAVLVLQTSKPGHQGLTQCMVKPVPH
jgi:hypothetical protein